MQDPRLRTWDEWLNVPFDNSASAECEVSGIVESMNSENRIKEISVKSSRLWIFRRLLKLWEHTRWSGEKDLSDMLKVPVSMHGNVKITFKRELYEDILSRGKACYDSKESWNWLRGIWGNNGNVYLPKNGYNLVIRSRSEDLHKRILGRLRSTGIKASARDKNRFSEIMIRNQNDLVTFLCKLKLYNTSLAIEQRSMVRAMRDRANKLVNCDSSNIRKSLEVAQEQIRIAKTLKEMGIYHSLPDKLKEIIDARMDNPSATLTELGTYLDRPVSKSTVKYRWSRIKDIINSSL